MISPTLSNKVILQDTFDTEYKEELEKLYATTIWSEVREELETRTSLVCCLEKYLQACMLQVHVNKKRTSEKIEELLCK